MDTMVKRPTPKRTFANQFRLSALEQRALEKAAETEQRPIAFIARRVVLEWLRAQGYLKS
jgi:hypothetical protein